MWFCWLVKENMSHMFLLSFCPFPISVTLYTNTYIIMLMSPLLWEICNMCTWNNDDKQSLKIIPFMFNFGL